MKNENLFSESNAATYCPEDDKLRLYVGRVPRDEYEALRKEGWTSTPKQDCDFVAVWTPARRDTAESYAGIIEDEDASPAERAADRAERFAGYQEKRLGEALQHGDRYDAGPTTHGFQSYARAVRAADRHDRHAGRAVDAWSKAEYWTSRTAGVIAHALHKSAPSVRMGRIKTLETELRRIESYYTPQDELVILQTPRNADKDAEKVPYRYCGQGRAGRWVEESQLEPLRRAYADEVDHLNLRLHYENQMLEAVGGRASLVEMEPGGFWAGDQIHKIHRSNASGNVTSVEVWASLPVFNYRTNCRDMVEGLHLINVERDSADAYTPPTPDDLEALAQKKKEIAAAKKAATVGKPKPAALINPTPEDAQKLQYIWNAANPPGRWDSDKEPKKIALLTQAQYSANSGGTYSACETVTICEEGTQHRKRYGDRITRHDVFKVRAYNGRVVILTDKPQKPLPFAEMNALRANCPQLASFDLETMQRLRAAVGVSWASNIAPENAQLWRDARYLGLAYYDSESQFGISKRGEDHIKALEQAALVTA